MVETVAQARTPVIYLANAGKIGSLDAGAMDVVIVYSLLEGARENIRLMGVSRTPDDINHAIVLQTAARTYREHPVGSPHGPERRAHQLSARLALAAHARPDEGCGLAAGGVVHAVA
jgi:hypothetical protein